MKFGLLFFWRRKGWASEGGGEAEEVCTVPTRWARHTVGLPPALAMISPRHTRALCCVASAVLLGAVDPHRKTGQI